MLTTISLTHLEESITIFSAAIKNFKLILMVLHSEYALIVPETYLKPTFKVFLYELKNCSNHSEHDTSVANYAPDHQWFVQSAKTYVRGHPEMADAQCPDNTEGFEGGITNGAYWYLKRG